jgi:hypothetical protein
MNSHRTQRRDGYTLLELIVSSSAASVLMVGMASTLVISSRAVCHHILEFSARVLAIFPCWNLRFGEISVEFPLGSRERRM